MNNTASNNRVYNRWGRRLPTRHEVELRALNGEWRAGCLENVSLSGGLVRTDLALRPHTKVRVLIPGIAEPVTGFVVRAGEGVLGIEWEGPAPHVVTYLRTSGAVDAAQACKDAKKPRHGSLNWQVLARGAKEMFVRHRH